MASWLYITFLSTGSQIKMGKKNKINKQNKPNISMFFPAYNEEENIPILIKSAKKVLDEVASNYEVIIVVYEGSTDRSIDIVKDFSKKDSRIKLVLQPKDKKGMGIALKLGFDNAKYENIFYADSDNQFDLQEFKKFLPEIGKADVIAGYRIKRQDPKTRIITSKCYNLLVKSIFGTKERDLDCAFRLVNKKIFNKLNLICKTGLGTTELLAKARRKRYTIKEIGVNHYPRTMGTPVFEMEVGLNLPKPRVVIDLLSEMVLLWVDIHIKRNLK